MSYDTILYESVTSRQNAKIKNRQILDQVRKKLKSLISSLSRDFGSGRELAAPRDSAVIVYVSNEHVFCYW